MFLNISGQNGDPDNVHLGAEILALLTGCPVGGGGGRFLSKVFFIVAEGKERKNDHLGKTEIIENTF